MPEGHNSIRKKLELISMYVQFLIQCLIGLNHFISCFSKGLCIRKKKKKIRALFLVIRFLNQARISYDF